MYIGVANGIPSIFRADVPMQNARFILSRGLRDKAELAVFMDPKAKVSRVQQTFTRQERRGGSQGVIVNWKIDLKACNPKCP